MTFALAVLAVAAIHFVLSFFVAFAAGVGGGPLFTVLASILTFPLNLLPKGLSLPGLLNWLPWALLSLGWGATICYAIRALSTRS